MINPAAIDSMVTCKYNKKHGETPDCLPRRIKKLITEKQEIYQNLGITGRLSNHDRHKVPFNKLYSDRGIKGITILYEKTITRDFIKVEIPEISNKLHDFFLNPQEEDLKFFPNIEKIIEDSDISTAAKGMLLRNISGCEDVEPPIAFFEENSIDLQHAALASNFGLSDQSLEEREDSGVTYYRARKDAYGFTFYPIAFKSEKRKRNTTIIFDTYFERGKAPLSITVNQEQEPDLVKDDLIHFMRIENIEKETARELNNLGFYAFIIPNQTAYSNKIHAVNIKTGFGGKIPENKLLKFFTALNNHIDGRFFNLLIYWVKSDDDSYMKFKMSAPWDIAVSPTCAVLPAELRLIKDYEEYAMMIR